jgi:hypothetical protein
MDWSKVPFGTREQRVAFNEALCRQLNERKAEWMTSGLVTAGFRCECVTLHCGSRFPLSAEHWREARSQPQRFVVAPGHIAPDVEVLVKEYPDFWLVEKHGKAADTAEKLD